jgi:hypothetical protein
VPEKSSLCEAQAEWLAEWLKSVKNVSSIRSVSHRLVR